MKDKITGIIKKIFSQREVTVFLIILLVVAITSIIQPKFLNSNNMRSIALSVSVDGLFAIGLTMALILGGIELSVGSVAAMTCVITGYLALQGVNIWVACIASICKWLGCRSFQWFYDFKNRFAALHCYIGYGKSCAGYGLHYKQQVHRFLFQDIYLNRSASLRQDQFLEYPFSSSYL